MSTENYFYIWSWEHDSWWAPNRRGYVENIRNAGKYSYADAIEICTGANFGFARHNDKMPYEGMVPVPPQHI